MASVKTGLKDLSVLQLIEKSRYIISQTSQNFSPPPQELALVIAATDALVEANLLAQAKGSYWFDVKKVRTKELLHQLRQLAAWVTMVSNRSETIITGSGFEVKKGNARLGSLPPPAGLVTLLTKMPGCIVLRWKPVHGKKLYGVEINRDDVMDESQWKHAISVTRAKAIIRNLENKQQYWVRVKAVGTAGASPPSEPVPGYVW